MIFLGDYYLNLYLISQMRPNFETKVSLESFLKRKYELVSL